MTDERIIAYLLEQLTEDEAEQFEEECFARDGWPDQIELVEWDLIDNYLRGDLAPEQRLRFEQNYLTTKARLERVRHAAALLRHADERPPPEVVSLAISPDRRAWGSRFRELWARKVWPASTAVTAALVLIVVGLWWLSRPRAPRPENVVALSLVASSSVRSAGEQVSRVRVTSETDALKVSLKLPETAAQAAGYSVRLEDENGEVKTAEMVGQDGQSVTVMIPAAQLGRGQFALKLFAVRTGPTEQSVGAYYFFVE